MSVYLGRGGGEVVQQLKKDSSQTSLIFNNKINKFKWPLNISETAIKNDKCSERTIVFDDKIESN